MNFTNSCPRRAQVIPAYDDDSTIRFLNRLRSKSIGQLPEIAPTTDAFLSAVRECPESIVMPASLRSYGLPDNAFADRELVEALIRRLFIDAALRRQFRDALSNRRFPIDIGRAGR